MPVSFPSPISCLLSRNHTSLLLPFIALASPAAWSQGQDDPASWPNRPVKLVVTTAAGQASDILARLLAQQLNKSFSQPFLVENRAGAGGLIGLSGVAKSPANGYTLVIATSGPMTIAPALNPNTPFDPVKDFAPIANIAITPQLVLVSAVSPYKSLAELVAASKQRNLAFATSSLGSTSHLAYEVFIKAAGTKFNLVPFKGNNEGSAQVLGGDVAAMFDTVPGALNLVKAGKLRPLGIASAQRSPFLPSVATFDEQGLRGAEAIGWIGFAAPAGTPATVLDKLNEQVRLMHGSSEGRQMLQTMAFAPATETTRAAFGALVASELSRWTRLVKEAGIKAE